MQLLSNTKPFSSDGFTLIEILVSVVILSLIILIVANIPQSIKLVGSSQHESIAKDVVVQEVERLRAISYDGLALGTSNINDARLASLPGVSAQETISNCPNTVCRNGEMAKMADLKVSWNEADNKVHNVEVVTLIAQGGLP